MMQQFLKLRKLLAVTAVFALTLLDSILFAYAADRITAFNISQPFAPQRVSSIADTTAFYLPVDMVISDNFLYYDGSYTTTVGNSTNTYSGMVGVDISDVYQMEKKAFVAGVPSALAFAAANGYLLVAWESPGIMIYHNDLVLGVKSPTGSNAERVYRLEQCYPNPFNPVTHIDFQIAKWSTVTIAVYDVLGREVQTLFRGTASAGAHTVAFDGTRFSSGVYFYRLEAGAFSDTKKLVLMK
jgi:hypothetical protein